MYSYMYSYISTFPGGGMGPGSIRNANAPDKVGRVAVREAALREVRLTAMSSR